MNKILIPLRMKLNGFVRYVGIKYVKVPFRGFRGEIRMAVTD
jgi:hypothetical protein